MNSLPQILHTISYMGLPLLLAMVFHEYAHGWVAHRYGDPTAKMAGRLTLNPLAHIDLMGTVIVPLMCLLMPVGIFFGWAKPVPVDPGLLRNPRRDMALVAAAGPAMNFVLAIASGLLLRLLFAMDPSLAEHWPPGPGWTPRDDLSSMILLPLAAMATYSILINLLLMVFNLIPIPPLDGGRVLSSLLPQDAALVLRRLEPYGMLVLLGLIGFDSQLRVISTIVGTIVPLLARAIVPAL
jgi:Zn-dependent protease